MREGMCGAGSLAQSPFATNDLYKPCKLIQQYTKKAGNDKHPEREPQCLFNAIQ